MMVVSAADTNADTNTAHMDADADIGAGGACAQQGNRKNGSE
jgi:hypothetical protein